MTSFSKILIANRGEIAVRVIRAARDEGIATVAVYADPDAEAPFVRMADEALALNGQTSAETYLDIDKILAAAGGVNSAAPLLAFELGGVVLLGIISAVAFATILAVVAGLLLGRTAARRPAVRP